LGKTWEEKKGKSEPDLPKDPRYTARTGDGKKMENAGSVEEGRGWNLDSGREVTEK